ncbi:SDR family oxidoreductase [Zeaxanthinibacter sp. PT1]|uniref:SDR family oxidoreductase n=1 Tax=Zeaxanthinibacter TaxID=561554 RepID=UPI0023498E8F|nr:SDR family oxidoreductase [Zeaxanthinibacter sp. PT1]MDC6351675.1 SDR family oxidoreductase [Zeaxanthinibacter sp. PT1]
MSSISGKVVWVTGASSGIGEALAFELSKNQCKLILSARTTERLQEVRHRCKFPENACILPMDLAAPEKAAEIVEKALSFFGHVDVLINNAGISQRSLISDTTFAVYKQLMDVNYLGTVALTNALLPHMVQRKSGQIAVVTSLMGKFGSPLRSGYCAAKHALHGYFDVLRMEHQADGIKVTLLCPGYVQTSIAKNALTGRGEKQGRTDKATEAGLEPAAVALKMINAISASKYEVYIGGKEIFGVYLKRWFPKLLHQVVMKSQVV